MLETNKYILNLYEMVYNNPMCDYATIIDNEERTQINVLFIGSQVKAVETYKTLFWASQYPDSILNMTFMGEQSEIDYVKATFGDTAQFPALEEYIQNGYANELQYIVRDNFGTGLEIVNNDYSYIIIATGDAYLDWEYLIKLEGLCGNNSEKSSKVLISVYNDGLDEKLAKINRDKLSKNVSIVQFEKSEEDIEKSNLRRIAANINLAYSVMYDERLNVKNNIEEFHSLCKEEFDVIDTQKYNADSSYACAVHISSKLSYCLQYNGVRKTDNWESAALNLLADAVKNDDKLYKKLYYLEHRRWNGYMIMKGYRKPQKGDGDFIYSDGKKNVDPDKKLHICLCESGSELNPDMKKASFWKEFKKQLYPLDFASFFCNKIATNKSKELQRRIYKQYSFLNSILFKELKEAVEDLFQEAGNANDNYKKTIKNFLERPDVLADDTLLKELKKMDKELEIVITRNKHINFFEYDAQLVRLLPFVLWYGDKYASVFVFSNGIPAEDVVIPTLLYAPKAYFVSDEEINEKKKAVIQNYFKNRGDNTHAEFISYSEMLKITNELSPDAYVIAGSGALKEDYLLKHNSIINARYNSEKNIINNVSLFSGLNRQSFSVQEFIRLQGGDVKTEYRDTLSNKTYIDYEKLFYDFSNTANSGSYKYVPWNKVIKIFTKDSRDNVSKIQFHTDNIHISEKDSNTVYICDTQISQEKYLENKVDVFLSELFDFHLIGKYESILEEQNIRIRFISYHKEICDIIASYTEDNDNCKMAGINIGQASLDSNNIFQLTSKECHIIPEKNNEIEFLANRYEPLLKNLIKLGALDSYKVDGKILKEISIKDFRIIDDLFGKEGDVFEKSVFHRFKYSNMFDDVRNGVYFYWNKEALDSDINKKKLKEKVEEIARQDILSLIDVTTFCKIHNDVCGKNKPDYMENQISNEIDVIAIRGMQVFFISCKSTSEIKKDYIDEIANHAKNAGAIPVLAMGRHIGQNSDTILRRAELNHVLLLGRDELKQLTAFNKVMNNAII